MMGQRVDDPAVQAAVTAFFSASALLDQMRMRIWDRDGLTVTQLRVLTHLNEREGLSNAELADLLYVTRPSVSALLERLERGGFIRREVAQNDRRGISIWLEERGRETVKNLRAETQDYAASLMEDLSPAEIDQLAASLNRLVESGRARRAEDLRAEQPA
jgi:DNA-binding MarR family transcriptional regulator